MNRSTMVKLGDLVVSSGHKAGAARTDLPVHSVTKYRGFVPSLEYFKKQVFSRDLSNYSRVAAGEFAYATIHLDEGSIGIAETECLISPMYTIFKVANDSVHAPYLLRYLKSPRALAEYAILGKGSVHRRRSISYAALSQMCVPLPSLTEQRRIAAILDGADALRAKRREALAHLDDLSQSIFYNMFGDPLQNQMNWPKKAIRDWGEITTGNTPPRADKSNYGPGIEWIKSDNLNSKDGIVTLAVETLSETGKSLARQVGPGSILVTCIAGSPASIGKAAIVDREVAFNQQINALTPDITDSRFLLAQLVAAKKLVQEKSSGGMKGLVSKSRFGAVLLLDPPVGLRKDFGNRATFIDRLNRIQGKQLAELDTLFVSLQSRAFAGEL
jgi:type I restriction enzyme S subunit